MKVTKPFPLVVIESLPSRLVSPLKVALPLRPTTILPPSVTVVSPVTFRCAPELPVVLPTVTREPLPFTSRPSFMVN